MTTDLTPSPERSPSRFPIVTPPSRPAVLAALGLIVVAVLIYLVGETLATFVLGLILILVLDPLVTWLTARGIPRPLSSVVSIALLAVIVIVFGYIVISALLHQGPAFIAAILSILGSAREWVAGSTLPDPLKEGAASIFVSVKASLASMDAGGLITNALATVAGVVSPIISLVLVLPFFMFYVLSDRPHLADVTRRSIPVQWRGDVLHLAGIFVRSFTTYIRAEALLMVILGGITFIGLVILGFVVDPRISEFALFLAVIAAFSELIPMFGPYIALVPALVFTVPLGPGPFLAVLVLYIVISFLEGNVLVPKIEGGQFELHPAFVIVLVLAGLALIGALGAVLAMPVAAAARDAFRYAFDRASGMPQPVVDDYGKIVVSEQAAMGQAPSDPADLEPAGS